MIQAAWRGWQHFWFDSRSDDTLIPLAAFRASFCFVMFICYFTRAFDVEFFYGFHGIMPSRYMDSFEQARFQMNLIGDSWPILWILALHSLFLVSLFCQALGLGTRYFSVLSYALHLLFMNRNISVIFGVDMIATFFLLYLCFVNSHARFSLDAKFGWAKKRQSPLSHLVFRLMQVQLCVVYGFSGMEKLKGVRWWDGSALWDVLSIGNMQRWDLSFVAHFPLLLSAAVYVVLAWEIYFPVLVWLKPLRKPVLFFGLLMHIGIYVFMNLPSFGFMMIALYILFLTKEEVLAGVDRMIGNFRALIPSRN